jgi:hypothetical protein
MKTLLELETTALSETTRALLKSLTKRNFALTDPDSYEDMCDLAYSLYVDDKAIEAKEVCDKFAGIEFQSNYDLWTWVEFALALRSRIADSNGSAVENTFLKRQVLRAVETGDEEKVQLRKKIHARFRNGSQVRFDKVQSAIDNGDADAELDWREVHLKNLILLEQFGSSDPVLAGSLGHQTESNLLAMRTLQKRGA